MREINYKYNYTYIYIMFAIPSNMDVDLKSLLLGMFIMFFILILISSVLPPPESSMNDFSSTVLTPSEACKLFYNCTSGYGKLANLNCNCSGEWHNFGLKELMEVVK